MFINLEALPDKSNIETDVCIVGAGAAGIALAREFYKKNIKVALIESGGLEEDKYIEILNEGENAGSHKINFYQRKRFFGGGTNCWGGNCAPFDHIDFEERPYLPYSSWPINFNEIQNYYPRVQKLCGLSKYSYESKYWENNSNHYAKQHIPNAGVNFTTKVFQNKALRFGQFYRYLIDDKSSNISVYLNATVKNIEISKNGKIVNRLHLLSLKQCQYTVDAKFFILAAGIENARLLLLSNDVNQKGVGNDYDIVGRFFMGHLLMFTGFLIENPPFRNLDLYKLTILGDETQRTIATFQLNDMAQKKYKLLNYVAHLSSPELLENWRDHIIRKSEHLKNDIQMVGRKIFNLKYHSKLEYLDYCKFDNSDYLSNKMSLYAIGSWSEQAPDPENRISLSINKDKFGMNKILMHWKLNELDKHTLIKGQQLLNEEFKRIGLGRIISHIPSYGEKWLSDIVFAAHYMGSTRMSNDPKQGVVNKHCQVHGVDNLYIAGGSVMPTSGASMVTYNLLALAIRLADHLKNKIKL